MYGFIFKNKLGALAFVGMTLYGVATLVGSEEDDGLLQKGVETIQSERRSFEEQIGEFGDPEMPDQGEDISLPFGQEFPDETSEEFGQASEEFAEPEERIGPAFQPSSPTFPTSPSDDGLPSDPGEIVGFVVDAKGNVVMSDRDGGR